MANTRRRPLCGVLGRSQREVICDVMRSAAQCDTWLTLDELAKLTKFLPTSISAQLRHLRQPSNGGYAVEKRQRFTGKAVHEAGRGPVWEYQLGERRGARVYPRKRVRRAATARCIR